MSKKSILYPYNTCPQNQYFNPYQKWSLKGPQIFLRLLYNTCQAIDVSNKHTYIFLYFNPYQKCPQNEYISEASKGPQIFLRLLYNTCQAIDVAIQTSNFVFRVNVDSLMLVRLLYATCEVYYWPKHKLRNSFSCRLYVCKHFYDCCTTLAQQKI